MTGLISISGVPSRTSRLDTLIFPASFISTISTSWSPIGFGLSGDLVANTPLVLALGLFLGLVSRTVRSPLSNHVSNIILAPFSNPAIAWRLKAALRSPAKISTRAARNTTIIHYMRAQRPDCSRNRTEAAVHCGANIAAFDRCCWPVAG